MDLIFNINKNNRSTLLNKFGNNFLLLKFTFWISLLGLFFSMILTHLFGQPILIYYIFYILVFVMLVFLFIPKFNLKFSGVSKNVFVFILYIIVITLPLTLINNHFTAFFVFCKNQLMPILLFLFYLKSIKNIEQLIAFLKIIIKGGVIFAGYICLEFANKLFNIFPFFNQIIAEYFVMNENDSVGSYMNPDNFDIQGLIRPLGLEISFTASGFFLTSIFFLLVISGHRFIKSANFKTFLVILLYISTIVTTSRQNIFALHLLLFLFYIILIKKKYLFNKIYIKSCKKYVFYVFMTLFIIISIIILSNISNYLEFLTETSGGTGSILSNDLVELPSSLFIIFMRYPINGLLGIGAYTSSLPGMYFQLPPINELHFLLDIFYLLGMIGFIIYWSIFITSVYTCWRAFLIKNSIFCKYKDLYLYGVFIGLLFIINIVHYAPIGLSVNFIISLIPLLSVFARKEILKSRVLKAK